MGFFGKVLGLFVERVPVDEQGRPVRTPVPPPKGAVPAPNQRPATPPPAQQLPQATPASRPPNGVPMPQQAAPQSGMHPQAPQLPQYPQQLQQVQMPPGAGPVPGSVAPSPAAPTVAVVLRAIVPPEYAAHLAPYGLHVLAAGGDVTSDQARGWGAQVLVISAECLGRDLHLLQTPQMPTVFISPQPVMIPEQPGVIQVHEPLHASDVARAVREAVHAWAAAGRSASN